MEEPENSTDDFINEWDGLNLDDDDDAPQDESRSIMPLESQDNDDFATSNTAAPNSVIIVTNLIQDAFTPSDAKTEFERLFLKYDKAVQFQYLKSFRRVRVMFSSIENAKRAHPKVNNSEILGQPIRCYFAQPISLTSEVVGNRQRLEPPPPDKQYLLSPPASPPPGWEVINERKPAINYDLIAAMAAMGPSNSYELHSGRGNQPSIVVHICEDPEGYAERPSKIPQTRRPDRKP